MNVDWNALNEGMRETLDKMAAPRVAAKPSNVVQFPGAATTPKPKSNPRPTPKAAPAAPTQQATPAKSKLPGIVTGTAVGGLGLGTALGAGKLIDAGRQTVEGLSGLLPGALGLLGGSPATQTGGESTGVLSNILSAIKAKPNLLNYDTASPHALGDAVAGAGTPNMGWSKNASITEAITKAVQTRAINDAMDKMLLAKQEAVPVAKDKELEITSKYPEMQSMLNDKQNKAYLESLLKE
jgi:hypothetical protein